MHPAAEPDAAIDLPYVAVMTIEAEKTDGAAAALKDNGVSFDRLADGTVTVAAEDANGVWLEFVAR